MGLAKDKSFSDVAVREIKPLLGEMRIRWGKNINPCPVPVSLVSGVGTVRPTIININYSKNWGLR